MVIGFLIVILLMLLANLGLVLGFVNGEVEEDGAVAPFVILNLLVTLFLITWDIYCIFNL